METENTDRKDALVDPREQAAELVSIIECSAGEPDAIARAIAPVYRQAEAAKDTCREILWYMLKAAFNASAAHSWAFEEYLAAIEQGREPSEEAVARFASQRESGDQPAALEADAEVVRGASVLVMGAGGAQLFRFDLADGERGDAVEFYVLDEGGARAHGIVVKATSAGHEDTE
jgi:hypothetical protein